MRPSRRARNQPVNDLESGAILAVRQRALHGLGFNAAFVDDDMRIAVLLAQRAVLAGLATDVHPDTLPLLVAASERYRAQHEAALGRPIGVAP